MPEWDLLNKNEMTIEPISLEKANLNDIAEVIADVLGMDRTDVFVTDLRKDVLTVDILKGCVNAYDIAGKEKKLLERLADLPGVSVREKTTIRSAGMLGWIALDEELAAQGLKRSEAMAAEIGRKLSKRVIVFSTGIEVEGGQIEDTNMATIASRMEAEGYVVKRGAVLKDDEETIAVALRNAIENYGYSLVITTGGVGAEDKDHTVEAIQRLDPGAAVPYICKFERGTGRHHKDGVRIAVGQYLDSVIVALPGPNDEVRIGLDVLIAGLSVHRERHGLAEEIAASLRHRLREKMKAHGCHER